VASAGPASNGSAGNCREHMGDRLHAFKRPEGAERASNRSGHDPCRQMNTMSFDKVGANPKMTYQTTCSPSRLRPRFSLRPPVHDHIGVQSMLKLGASRLAIPAMAMLMLALVSTTASAEPRATEFKLSNGMDVVVIPDHRAPVVTHMVWYRVGAADEPKGVSGIAHFL
jgi:hypothetical protein